MRSFALCRARDGNYPGVFADFHAMIGNEKALVLAEIMGGTRLYIPNKPSTGHALIKWLGTDIAQQVCAEFGGITLEIPRFCQALRAARNSRIMADIAAGMSTRNVAIKYQMTDRNIRMIKQQRSIKTSPYAE